MCRGRRDYAYSPTLSTRGCMEVAPHDLSTRNTLVSQRHGRQDGLYQSREPLLFTGVMYAVDAYKSHKAKKEAGALVLEEPADYPRNAVDVAGMQENVRRGSEAVREDAPPPYEASHPENGGAEVDPAKEEFMNLERHQLFRPQVSRPKERDEISEVNSRFTNSSQLSHKYAAKLARKEAKLTARLEKKAEKYARKAAKHARF